MGDICFGFDFPGDFPDERYRGKKFMVAMNGENGDFYDYLTDKAFGKKVSEYIGNMSPELSILLPSF